MHKLAKISNEGYGSSYEYIAKYALLNNLDNRWQIRGRFTYLFIFGFPEKYGFSLDFLLWAKAFEIKQIIIWNNSGEKFLRFEQMMESIWEILGESYEIRFIDEMADVLSLPPSDIFCVSCEVFQSLEEENKYKFAEICNYFQYSVIFLPNNYNNAHHKYTKLSTIPQNDLHRYFRNILEEGYLDMPPAPSGFELPKRDKVLTNIKISIRDKAILFLLKVWFSTVDLVVAKFLPPFYKRYSHLFWIFIGKA